MCLNHPELGHKHHANLVSHDVDREGSVQSGGSSTSNQEIRSVCRVVVHLFRVVQAHRTSSKTYTQTECKTERKQNVNFLMTPTVHVNSFKETRQSKQLRSKTTPFFLERKNELPRAEFEPATFCMLGERCTN